MQDGHVCASTALAALLASLLHQAQTGLPAYQWLESALLAANESVYRSYMSNGGTTLSVLLLLEGESGYWASVGDSRIYAVDDAMVQLSKDDTIAGQLGKQRGAAEQSKLLQYIGIGSSLEVSVHVVPPEQQGMALLTTDGVHFLESATGILELVVRNANDFGTCVRRLIELSRWSGGPDNATAVAIPFGSAALVHDTPMSSSSLDVWDAFGEVRILNFDATQREKREVIHPPAFVRDMPGIPDTPTEDGQDNDSLSTPQPAETKRKRKPKSKSKTDSKVPQVQIQFSDKES